MLGQDFRTHPRKDRQPATTVHPRSSLAFAASSCRRSESFADSAPALAAVTGYFLNAGPRAPRTTCRRIPYLQGLTAGVAGACLSAILVHSISSALGPASGIDPAQPDRTRWLPSTAAFAAPMPTPARFDLAATLPPAPPPDKDPVPVESYLRLYSESPAPRSPAGGLPPETEDALPLPEGAQGRGAGGAIEQVVRVQRGDTLLALLAEAGISRTEAHEAIEALRDAFAPNDLMPGQEITLSLNADDDASDPDLQLVGLTLQPSVERDVRLQRDQDGGFTVETVERPLSLQVARVAAGIRSSLFAAGQEADLPPAVLSEVIRAFSYDVDFQRDIQPGDTFEIVYQRYQDDRGNLARLGEVLFAGLRLGGREIALYRFDPQDGPPDYFTRGGESVRKALLRTPVDGARISSTFGMRKHPILGFSRMHKGVDFAAPPGTPIFAAGDGRIVRLGRNGGYGNYILIRHNDKYSTAYAHVSRFASGLRVGSAVRQGQVIAYVGSTGRSTGPHLHYEVLMGGKQINPQSVSVPAGQMLAGRDLTAFRAAVSEVDRLRDALVHQPLLLVEDEQH